MAQFSDFLPTKLGLDMIAQSQAGSQLIFTKVQLGDGQLGSTAVTDLTALINKKMDVPVKSVKALTDGHVQVNFTADNSSLAAGFFVREVGLFAKIGTNGTEKLYGYSNAGNTAGYMSDKTTPIDALNVNIDVVIGAAQSVSFVADKTLVYVTMKDLDDHNTNPSAHANLTLTLDQATTPANSGTLKNLLGGLAHQIQAIMGTTDWKATPGMSILNIVKSMTAVESYDVKDPNAWWIKLRGAPGIIIQGGLSLAYNQTHPWYFTYPVAVSSALGAFLVRRSGKKVVSQKILSIENNKLYFTDFVDDTNHGTGEQTGVIVIGIAV